MKNYYVYEYLREDGTPYYIGKGKGNRAYLNGRSIPKPPQFDRIHLIKENLTEEEAFALERNLIAKYGRKDLDTGILRNLTDGGEGVSGRITKLESIEKRVAKNTGKKRTLEQKERMSQAQLVRKQKSEEEQQAISEKISANRKGKGIAPKSKEHKAKLSQLNKGKSPGKRSEETKQKVSKANKGKIHSSETIEKRKNSFRI